ncbi:MAG: hypothetical protein EHM33_27385, partial [Chloroflexi bacterium]
MKTITRIIFPMLLVFSMLISACGGAVTTEPPQATQEATQPSEATEAPGSTEAPGATEAPVGGGECPAGVEGVAIEMWSPFTGPDGDEMTALADR